MSSAASRLLASSKWRAWEIALWVAAFIAPMVRVLGSYASCKPATAASLSERTA